MSYPLFEHQPYDLALATKMATVARSEKLDLLHVHYAIPHSISAILARESLKPHRTLPVITTLHGTDITLVGQDPSFHAITKFSIERSDSISAVTDYLKLVPDQISRWVPGAWNLGRWGMTVVVVASVWVVFEYFNIAWPRASLAPPGAPTYQVWSAVIVLAAIGAAGTAYLLVARPHEKLAGR